MRALICIAFAAAALPSVAAAQRVPVSERSSSFKPSGPKVGAKDTRQVMQKFARCLAKRSMSGVAEFLDEKMDGLSPALRSRAADCLGESIESDQAALKGETDTYRYALAEAWLVREFGESGVGDLSSVAPLGSAQTGRSENPGLQALAECVIRRDPTGTWALLRTDAAGAEEKALFQRLAPALQACVAQGSTLKMQAFFVRGAIAETYYLLSKAPRLATGGTQ